MRQLKIAPKDLAVHSALYSSAIAKVLDALVEDGCFYTNGFKTQHSIPQSKHICCDHYFRLVRDVHAAWDLLTLPSARLAIIASWIGAVKSAMRELDKEAIKKCDELLKAVFSYEEFGNGSRPVVERVGGQTNLRWEDCSEQWSAWHFVSHLDTRACCYCNAETIFSLLLNSPVPGLKMSARELKSLRKRSALDHFFGHSEHPYLGLSLYNLIPACTRCNTNIKGAKELSYGDYAHPYESNIDDGIEFAAIYNDKIKFEDIRDDDIIVSIVPRAVGNSVLAQQATNTAEFFHLNEVYNQLYRCDAADVIRNTTLVPKSYRQWLDHKYPLMSAAYKDRMLYGASLDPKDINRHILSKLTIDLHRQFLPFQPSTF